MAKIMHHIFWALIGYAVVFALLVSFEYLFLRVMPISHWSELEYVRPTQEVYDRNAEWEFASGYTYNKPAKVDWIDTLFCRTNGDFVGYPAWSSTNGRGVPNWIPKLNENNEATWAYRGEKPTTPATCIMRAVFTVFLPYNIEKEMTVFSEPFEVK